MELYTGDIEGIEVDWTIKVSNDTLCFEPVAPHWQATGSRLHFHHNLTGYIQCIDFNRKDGSQE